MLIYVRHGQTDLNAAGNGERLRGWLPVPLTKKGEAQAHDAARQITLRPDTFEASDLPRALQTANIVGAHLGIDPQPNPAIRDWNTGRLAGTHVKDSLPILQRLIDQPTQPAPDGEPFQDYLDRFVPLMQSKILDSGIHLVVGHARGASVIESLAHPETGRGQIDPSIIKEKPDVQPGGVLLVTPSWGVKVINPRG